MRGCVRGFVGGCGGRGGRTPECRFCAHFLWATLFLLAGCPKTVGVWYPPTAVAIRCQFLLHLVSGGRQGDVCAGFVGKVRRIINVPGAPNSPR